MRFNATTGLTPGQYEEVARLVGEAINWDLPNGRPHKLPLHRAVRVTLTYLRTNLTEEFLADSYDVSQKTISRIICHLTGLIGKVLAHFVPSWALVAQVVATQVVLLDGTLLPCWSWHDQHRLWSGKHKTTGHNIQVLCTLAGTLVWMSQPYDGSTHDAKAFADLKLATILNATNTIADKGYIGCKITTPIRKPAGANLTPAQQEWNTTIAGYRWIVERDNANIKTWRILFTDYRRPLRTFTETYTTVRALQFFRNSFD